MMNNDTIYRQAAIDAVLSVIPYDEYWKEQVTKAVTNLPSTQKKKGKWIDGDDGTYCGVCGSYPYDDGEYHILRWRSAFCPSCGANMRGEENDICGDNRFKIIEAYKKKLIEATNIESSPEEMAVIDNILFRFWQMGWLPSVEPQRKEGRE